LAHPAELPTTFRPPVVVSDARPIAASFALLEIET
jgi:hypothetical protein